MSWGSFFRRSEPRPAAAGSQELTFLVEWPTAIVGRVADLPEPHILVTDAGPLRARDVQELRHAMGEGSGPLVLVAPAFDADCTSATVPPGVFPVRACDTNAESKEDILSDLAVLTGARLQAVALGAGLGRPPEPGKTPGGLVLPGYGWSDVSPGDAGRAVRAVVEEGRLTFHVAPSRDIDAHLNSLLGQFKQAADDAQRESVARRFVRFGRALPSAKIDHSDPGLPAQACQIRGGLASPFFVTDASRGWADVQDSRLLVADLDLHAMNLLTDLADSVVREGKPLVVIARRVTGSALSFLAVNKLRGVLPSAAIGALGLQGRAGNAFREVAAATGSRWIQHPAGLGAGTAILGRAKRIIAAQRWTVVVP